MLFLLSVIVIGFEILKIWVINNNNNNNNLNLYIIVAQLLRLRCATKTKVPKRYVQ